ncbi:MAG: hypothetical protein ACJ0BK_01245 [Coraliomargaritaceae bacterium]
MQSTTASILAFSLLLSSSLHAQFNPFDWFGGEDEDLVALNLASAADESEATDSPQFCQGKACRWQHWFS